MSLTSNLRCVVFSKDKGFRQVLRAVLKDLGFVKSSMETETHSARNALLADPDSYLVVDWDMGMEVIVTLLDTARSKFKIDNRPIVVFSREVTTQLVAVSHEYNASQVVVGELTHALVKQKIARTVEGERPMQPIRRLLKQVGALRVKDDWTSATKVLSDLYTQTKGSEFVLVEYCENLAHESRWDVVENLLAKTVTAQPPNPKAIHLYAKAMMHKGDFEQAERILKKAKIMNPENAGRLIDLGEALFSLSKVDEAFSNFEEASALAPTENRAQMGMGKCMLVQGDVDEGLALLRHSSSEAQIASVFNTAAIFCMRGKKFKEGMELYRKALDAISENAVARSRLLFNTGLGFRRWHKPREALKYFEEAFLADQSFDKAQDFIRSTEKILLDSGLDESLTEESFKPREVKQKRQPQSKKIGSSPLDLETLEGAIEEIEDSFQPGSTASDNLDFDEDEDFADMDEINFV